MSKTILAIGGHIGDAELTAGGVLAAKTGLLAKIGLLLLKAWKLVLVAAVAIGALFRRIAGRGKRDGGAQA